MSRPRPQATLRYCRNTRPPVFVRHQLSTFPFLIARPGLLFGALHTQAEARTVCYEFDVVGSVIDYRRVNDIHGAPLTAGTVDYDAYVAAYHPLAHLTGQTGHTVFEVQDYDDWVNGGFAGARFNCLSGLFCPFDSGGHTTFNTSSGFRSYGGQFYWTLAGNTMTFSDDGGIAGWGDLPIASVMTKRLTSCRVPHLRLGQAAAEMMLARLSDEPVAPCRDIGFTLVPGSTVRGTQAA